MSSLASHPKAALLAIGDEVLRGEVPNTNAAFISERLFEIGIEVGEQLVVSDDPTAIREALVGLRYQNAKSVLTVAGDPLPVQMARSQARGEAR